MSSAFSGGAKQAVEKKEATHSKVLWLLSDACSLVLSPKSRNEPFKPFSVINGRRSAIPDDFSTSEIDLFAQVVDDGRRSLVDGHDLADLGLAEKSSLVITNLPLRQSMPTALFRLDNDTWIHLMAKECWERAIQLARMLGKGCGRPNREDRIRDLGGIQVGDGARRFSVPSLSRLAGNECLRRYKWHNDRGEAGIDCGRV